MFDIDKSIKNILKKNKKQSLFSFDKSVHKIIGKPKKFGGKIDWDGDGIINKRDCQPFNVMRQDIMGYHGSPEADKIRREGFKVGRRGVSFAPHTPAGEKYSLIYTAPRDQLVTDAQKKEMNIQTQKPIYGLGEKTNPKNILTATITNDSKFATENEWREAMRRQDLDWMREGETREEKSLKEQRAIEDLKRQGYRGLNLSNREYTSFYPEDIQVIR